MKKRISRKESQQQTRERLLDAALEVFSRRGYYGASVDEVATEAGYSKGAVYSNFSNKEELFLALVDRRFARDAQEYPGVVRFMAGGPEAGGDGDFFKKQVDNDRTWNILMIEFFLYAIREASNRAELAARLGQLRGLMGESLIARYKELKKNPALPVEELPWSIFSLGYGLTLQYYVDPNGLPDGLYERTLQHLLK